MNARLELVPLDQETAFDFIRRHHRHHRPPVGDVLLACSMLYGACVRMALAAGYRRVVTYVLASEGGASARAAGFRIVAQVKGRSWSCPSRPRVDKHPTQDKLRLEFAA